MSINEYFETKRKIEEQKEKNRIYQKQQDAKNKTYQTQQKLLKKAKKIDDVDRVLGPLSFGLIALNYVVSNLGMDIPILKEYPSQIVQDLAIGMDIIQYTMKLPFMINYMTKSKDYASTITLLAGELIKSKLDWGQILQLNRNYEKTIKLYINRK